MSDEAPKYPVWRFHADQPAGHIVYSEEEDAQLGEGWVDSPAKIGVHDKHDDEPDDEPDDEKPSPKRKKKRE